MTITRASLILTIGLFPGLFLSLPAMADERPDHFEGKPATTLAEALDNLAVGNARLNELLKQPDLSARDLYEVHQLTYTLENAIARMETELADLAETLEAVHLASEKNDADTVHEQGNKYLRKAAPWTGH